MAALEQRFIQDGGYSEKLAAARIGQRSAETEAPSVEAPPAPLCPECERPMALRTARHGPNAGRQFWGCSGFPDCKRILQV